jgi:multisubunit Na+/H+ antiporter MnhB subunit
VRRSLLILALVLALGGVLAAGLAGGAADAPDGTLRRYFAAHGPEETGSINLVSSIYLGYRAFDTLGETVIFFLAVTGVMTLRGGRE